MKKSFTKAAHFIFLYLLILGASGALSQNAKVWIEPPQTNVKISDSFTVEIVVDSVINLGAFQFDIEYSVSPVKADSAWLGSFPGSSGRTVSAVGPSIDNSGLTGSVSFGGFSLGSTPPGPDGFGVLAIVKFTAQDTGTAILDLKNVQIVDINGQTQPISSTTDTQVSITFQLPPVDPFKTSVTAWPDTIPADGSSTSTITVTPKDSLGGNLGIGQTVEVSTTAGSLLGSVSDMGDGTYTQLSQSSIIPEIAVITVTVNGITISQKPQVAFAAPGVDSVIVKIVPSDTSVTVGETFLIDVIIDSAKNLGSFQFDIEYWSRIVRTDAACIGDFLGSTGRNVATVGPAIDNTSDSGKVTFGGFSFGTNNGPNGTGVLASIRFTAQETGSTVLALKNIQITDIDSNLLPLKLVIDGYVSIISPEAVNSSDIILPQKSFLWPNYPNPFNPETMIRYQLPKPVEVRLEICNITGQLIKALVDQNQPAGYYSVTWNGKNDTGQHLSSGVYFYVLKAGSFVQIRKMVLVR